MNFLGPESAVLAAWAAVALAVVGGLWTVIGRLRTFNARRIKLRGSCYVEKDFYIRDLEAKEDRLMLRMENYGNRPITVKKILFRVGKKESGNAVSVDFFLDIDKSIGGLPFRFRTDSEIKEFPFTLDAGDGIRWHFALKRTIAWVVSICVKSEKDAKKLRLFAYVKNRQRPVAISLEASAEEAVIAALHGKAS